MSHPGTRGLHAPRETGVGVHRRRGDEDCGWAMQVQLTQPVGRSKDLGVTHMATVRWDAGGAPSLNLHANTLWPGVVMQPHGSAGWRRGTVTDASAGAHRALHASAARMCARSARLGAELRGE